MRPISRLFTTGTAAGLTDGELLARFLEHREQAAFEALVARHGPMVLAVCRGVLRDTVAAEDASQATFLVLFKKARSLRGRDTLAFWLRRVARRAASRAAWRERRRRSVEAAAGTVIAARAAEADTWDVLRPALHDEVAHLPERYRSAVSVCDLEGVPPAEAAARLHWSERTLYRRLAYAHSLLRDRLGCRRGAGSTAARVGAEHAREAQN